MTLPICLPSPTIDSPPSRPDVLRWPKPTWLASHPPNPQQAHTPSPQETMGVRAVPFSFFTLTPGASPKKSTGGEASMTLSDHQAVRLLTVLSRLQGQRQHGLHMPQHSKAAGEEAIPSPFRDLTMFRVNDLSWRNTTALPTRLKIY